MQKITVLALLMLATSASAQSQYKCYHSDGSVWYQSRSCPTPSPYGSALRKCVSPKGAASFQQEPCASGSRQVSVREVRPEAPSTQEQVQSRRAKTERDRTESAYLSRSAGTDRRSAPKLHIVSMAADAHACEAARANREAVLKAVGLRRTYDLLRSLNDKVAQACR